MIIRYKIADPKTAWWSNLAPRTRKGKATHRTRIDSLIGFNRMFIRESQVYIYTFTCGRFQIGFLKARK